MVFFHIPIPTKLVLIESSRQLVARNGIVRMNNNVIFLWKIGSCYGSLKFFTSIFFLKRCPKFNIPLTFYVDLLM